MEENLHHLYETMQIMGYINWCRISSINSILYGFHASQANFAQSEHAFLFCAPRLHNDFPVGSSHRMKDPQEMVSYDMLWSLGEFKNAFRNFRGTSLHLERNCRGKDMNSILRVDFVCFCWPLLGKIDHQICIDVVFNCQTFDDLAHHTLLHTYFFHLLYRSLRPKMPQIITSGVHGKSPKFYAPRNGWTTQLKKYPILLPYVYILEPGALPLSTSHEKRSFEHTNTHTHTNTIKTTPLQSLIYVPLVLHPSCQNPRPVSADLLDRGEMHCWDLEIHLRPIDKCWDTLRKMR